MPGFLDFKAGEKFLINVRTYFLNKNFSRILGGFF